MTSVEYQRIREMIEGRFRQDMAALERVWFTINGCNPPDSPVALAKPAEEEDATIVLGPRSDAPVKRKWAWSPEARERARQRRIAFVNKRK